MARRVVRAPNLSLAGVTAFEGTIAADRSPSAIDDVRAFLDRVAAASAAIRDEEAAVPLVSAGGTVFFDLVVERLSVSRRSMDVLLLRSG